MLKVIGKGQEDTEDKEGQTNDSDREGIPGPVLPEIVQGLPAEIVQFLDD